MDNILWFSFATVVGMSWVITLIQRDEYIRGLNWRIASLRALSYFGSLFLLICQPLFWDCTAKDGSFDVGEYLFGYLVLTLIQIAVSLVSWGLIAILADIFQLTPPRFVEKILNESPSFLKKNE